MWRRKLEGAGSAVAEPRTGRGGCDLQNRGAGRGVPGYAQSGWAYSSGSVPAWSGWGRSAIPTPAKNIRSLTKAVQRRAPLHSGEGKGLKEAAARSLTPLLPSFVFTRVRHPRRRE